MTQNQTTNAGRITIIDALRGFALFGVIWVHFQQHFSYFSRGPFNEHTPILSQCNDGPLYQYLCFLIRYEFLYPDGSCRKERY